MKNTNLIPFTTAHLPRHIVEALADVPEPQALQRLCELLDNELATRKAELAASIVSLEITRKRNAALNSCERPWEAVTNAEGLLSCASNLTSLLGEFEANAARAHSEREALSALTAEVKAYAEADTLSHDTAEAIAGKQFRANILPDRIAKFESNAQAAALKMVSVLVFLEPAVARLLERIREGYVAISDHAPLPMKVRHSAVESARVALSRWHAAFARSQSTPDTILGVVERSRQVAEEAGRVVEELAKVEAVFNGTVPERRPAGWGVYLVGECTCGCVRSGSPEGIVAAQSAA